MNVYTPPITALPTPPALTWSPAISVTAYRAMRSSGLSVSVNTSITAYLTLHSCRNNRLETSVRDSGDSNINISYSKELLQLDILRDKGQHIEPSWATRCTIILFRGICYLHSPNRWSDVQ